MNKKKIGALLVGATLLVGAMGSFAYFTGTKSDINGGNGGALQTINITNGKVEILAKGANEGENATDWTYDVAKYSSDINPKEEGIQLPNKKDTEEAMLMTDFEKIHRSPNINALNKAADGNGDIERAVIGSHFTKMAIENARPGDAIVLGTAVSGEPNVSGLVVTNNSNLTVKMQLVIKNDPNSIAQLNNMKNAGWKMYVGGQEVDFVKQEGSNNYQEKNRIIIDLGVVSPNGNSTKIPDIRFELPLTTGNGYQGKEDSTAGKVEGIDLSQIIEIQATQENNPGWNQNGTGDRISNNTTITQPENGQDQPEIQE